MNKKILLLLALVFSTQGLHAVRYTVTQNGQPVLSLFLGQDARQRRTMSAASWIIALAALYGIWHGVVIVNNKTGFTDALRRLLSLR